jgi:hypothetical protein
MLHTAAITRQPNVGLPCAGPHPRTRPFLFAHGAGQRAAASISSSLALGLTPPPERLLAFPSTPAGGITLRRERPESWVLRCA